MSDYRINLLIRFILALLIILVVLAQLNDHGSVPEYLLAALATIMLYFFGSRSNSNGNKEKPLDSRTNSDTETGTTKPSDNP